MFWFRFLVLPIAACFFSLLSSFLLACFLPRLACFWLRPLAFCFLILPLASCILSFLLLLRLFRALASCSISCPVFSDVLPLLSAGIVGYLFITIYSDIYIELYMFIIVYTYIYFWEVKVAQRAIWHCWSKCLVFKIQENVDRILTYRTLDSMGRLILNYSARQTNGFGPWWSSLICCPTPWKPMSLVTMLVSLHVRKDPSGSRAFGYCPRCSWLHCWRIWSPTMQPSLHVQTSCFGFRL